MSWRHTAAMLRANLGRTEKLVGWALADHARDPDDEKNPNEVWIGRNRIRSYTGYSYATIADALSSLQEHKAIEKVAKAAPGRPARYRIDLERLETDLRSQRVTALDTSNGSSPPEALDGSGPPEPLEGNGSRNPVTAPAHRINGSSPPDSNHQEPSSEPSSSSSAEEEDSKRKRIEEEPDELADELDKLIAEKLAATPNVINNTAAWKATVRAKPETIAEAKERLADRRAQAERNADYELEQQDADNDDPHRRGGTHTFKASDTDPTYCVRRPDGATRPCGRSERHEHHWTDEEVTTTCPDTDQPHNAEATERNGIALKRCTNCGLEIDQPKARSTA